MTILLYVLIVIFILDVVLLTWSLIFTEHLKIFIGTFVVLILLCIGVHMLPDKTPSKLYQEKVEAVEKANKELEKFLIDYPEFRKE